MTSYPIRNRLISAGWVVTTAWLGVLARHYGDLLPDFVAGYAPDTLWAMAVFGAFGLVFPTAATWQVASGAYLISALVEVSLLSHEGWIDAIRGTPLGPLAIGPELLTTDLASYAFGVFLGMLIELWTLH